MQILPLLLTFAVELYGQIAAKEQGNILISPASVGVAMAMVLDGARGDTAAEIAAALHLPATLDPAQRRALRGALEERPQFELRVANRLWPQAGAPLER